MTSQVTRETIDLNGLLARAKNAAAGAVLLFSGDVRDHSEGRAVDFLEYETHESMAQKQIAEIVLEAKKPLGPALCGSHPPIWQNADLRLFYWYRGGEFTSKRCL